MPAKQEPCAGPRWGLDTPTFRELTMQERSRPCSHMCVLLDVARTGRTGGGAGSGRDPSSRGFRKVNSLSFPGQIEAQGVKKRAGAFQRGA